MKAAQCDKCGVLFEHRNGDTLALTGWPVGGRLRAGWYPREVDVCDDCMRPLIVFIEQWWKAPAQTSTTTINPFALVPAEDERAAVLCEQAAARLRRQSIGTAAAERVARAAIDAEREARETA